jgi:TonB family protein
VSEPIAPRADRIPEAPRQAPAPAAPAPAAPERGGLSLGGPRPAAPFLPGSTGAPPSGGAARPSIRDQIASLGSGLTADLGGPAKRTISLDSREEHFIEYLARLKRRVQRVWKYPEEAVKEGIGGELQIVFTLNSAGSLIYMSLAQSSGFPILDEEALRAVKLSAPFDPFLPQMGDEPLNIHGTFYYDLPRRFRRN